MVGVFDILYLPLWNPIDIFYYVMNLWKLRRPDFITLALLASDLLEFVQWWTKVIVESVGKEISGLILSSDSFPAGKWPSFSTEAQSSESLTFSCSYVQHSLETAISILFLCSVGLKVFMHPYSCLSQRVLLFLLSYP